MNSRSTDGRIAEIAREASRCLLPLPEARGLPAAAFTDPAWFEAEQRTVHKAWHELPQADHDVLATEMALTGIAGQPYVGAEGATIVPPSWEGQ